MCITRFKLQKKKSERENTQTHTHMCRKPTDHKVIIENYIKQWHPVFDAMDHLEVEHYCKENWWGEQLQTTRDEGEKQSLQKA